MIEQLNAVADAWWGWILALLWQVGLLIVLIACIDRLIRRWAWPQLRYALWSLVLIKLLLPPTLSLPSGVVPTLRPVANRTWQALQPKKRVHIADGGLPLADSVPRVNTSTPLISPPWTTNAYVQTERFAVQKGLDKRGRSSGALAAVMPVTPQSEIHNSQLSWHVYAMAIWLAGTLSLGTWLLLRLHALAGRGANRAADASLPQSFYNQMAGCAAHLGLRRVPRVVVVKKLATPAVFGVFRPVLLMPRGYLRRLSRRDTEHMLLHELAHIKRGDLYMHALYMLLQIIHWYNPLLWLVRRQLHHLRELSCDATVANLLREQTSAYRQTLLETARRFLARSTEPGLGLLGLFEDSNRLAVRLRWLQRPTWRYRTMKRVTVFAFAALMFACVLPMAQGQGNTAVEVSNESADQIQDNNETNQELEDLKVKLEKLELERQKLQKELQSMVQARQAAAQAKTQSMQAALQAKKAQDAAAKAAVKAKEAAVKAKAIQARQQTGTYTIRPGDTLSAIVEKFYGQDENGQDENIDRLVQANHLEHADGLRVGQHLVIPHPGFDKEWAKDMQAWAEQIEQWEQGPEMQKWQQAMEQWEKDVQNWSETLARQYDADADTGPADATPPAPMPAMPAIPARPAAPAVPSATPHTPVHGDLSDAFDGDRIIDADLPERLSLVDLVDLVGKYTHLSFVYDPETVTGEITLKITPHSEIHVKDLYLLLESALNFKDLAMTRCDGNTIAIGPKVATMPEVHLPARPHVNVQPDVHVDVQSDDSKAKAVETINFTSPLIAGGLLIVENRVGGITVRGAATDGCHINVTVTAKAETQEKARTMAHAVHMEYDSSDRRIFTKPVKPDDNEWKNIDVAFEITVPYRANLQLAAEVGGVCIRDVQGQVTVKTNVGTITTKNAQGDIDLEANVGDIQFVAPDDLSAKITASTDIGKIDSDLPIEIDGQGRSDKGGFHIAMGSKATGTLGTGEGTVKLKSNVGSISIRSKGSSGTPVNIKKISSVQPASAVVTTSDASGVRMIESIKETQEDGRYVLRRTESETLPLTPGSAIDVINENGAITVTGTDGDTFQLQAVLTVKGPAAETTRKLSKTIWVDVTPKDKGLGVAVARPKQVPDEHSYSVDLQILVPRRANLNVMNEDGDVKVVGVEGQVRLALEDGDVLCERLTGMLTLNLEDGQVKIDRSTFSDCRVVMEDGGIKCSDVSGNLDIQLEDGPVKIACADELPESGTIKVVLGDGNIKLSAPSTMFPTDGSAKVQHEDDSAKWHTQVQTDRGRHTVILLVDDGSIKVDKR